jgi:hypothetical protein
MQRAPSARPHSVGNADRGHAFACRRERALLCAVQRQFVVKLRIPIERVSAFNQGNPEISMLSLPNALNTVDEIACSPEILLEQVFNSRR